MYNQELAAQVLNLLADEFPRRLPVSEVKQKLSAFAGLTDREWALAILALHKSGLVDAQFMLEDQSYDPVDVASVEITAAGRRQVAHPSRPTHPRPAQTIAELPGRMDLLEQARKLIHQAGPVSVLFIDLDGFKQVNDRLGHAKGDEYLEKVLKTLRDVIEGKGSVFRYGGDEFVVLLPNFNETEAAATAERLRADVDGANAGLVPPMTASVGIAFALQPQDTTATNLVKAADEAMYEAKHAGGNRVVTHAASPGPIQRTTGSPVLNPRTGDITKRVDAVEISASLNQGIAQNFLINVKNESDEEVSVKRVCLQQNGIRLADPGRPRPGDNWTIPPKSARPIGWPVSPDPAIALHTIQPNVAVGSRTEMDIVLTCDILGRSKEFRQRILVQVDVTNRRVDQVAG